MSQEIKESTPAVAENVEADQQETDSPTSTIGSQEVAGKTESNSDESVKVVGTKSPGDDVVVLSSDGSQKSSSDDSEKSQTQECSQISISTNGSSSDDSQKLSEIEETNGSNGKAEENDGVITLSSSPESEEQNNKGVKRKSDVEDPTAKKILKVAEEDQESATA